MTQPTRLSRRSFLISLGSSTALLIAGCAPQAQPPSTEATSAPAPEAAEADTAPTAAEADAAPAGGPKADVARKDTLVHYGGDTEVLEPTNFNPYSLGGLGRIRGPLNKTIFEFLYYYNHNDGAEIPWLAESYTVSDDFTS